MRRFKYLRNVNKPYNEQAFIFYTCMTYERQPKRVRRKIDMLCERAGGEYAGALKAYLCTDIGWVATCDQYFISSSTLERIRTEFFQLWQ